jgi:hypothetical protein
MARRTTRRKTSRTKRRPWTKAEATALKKHSQKKTAVAQISRSMKRSQGSIRQKALSLNMSIGYRRYYQPVVQENSPPNRIARVSAPRSHI